MIKGNNKKVKVKESEWDKKSESIKKMGMVSS